MTAITLIETKTLGADAASIEFTSIPQTFTDLLVLASTRATTAGTGVQACLINFNSITDDFTYRIMNGNGSTVTQTTGGGIAFNAPSTGTTANTFGNVSVYIPNYAGATFKSYSTDSVTEHNATEAHQTIISGLWADTAAITSVLFAPTANNFIAGSTISLYGILKGSDGIVTTS